MSTQEITVDNGVNVTALLGAREALTEAPEAARFKWRTTSEWVGGTHTKSAVEKYFGLGEEQSHRQAYNYDTDHPEVFASEDNGSTPVEFVLVGLAGCLTAGIAAVHRIEAFNFALSRRRWRAVWISRESWELTAMSATASIA